MRSILLMALFMLTTACQTYPPSSEDSPYYAVPLGSRLTLNRPIRISSGQTQVHFQGGEIVPYEDLDAYYAHCRLRLSLSTPILGAIEPDEFVVHKVTQEIRVSYMTLVLASAGDSDDDAVDTKFYARILHLRSKRQPGVLRMSCQRWDDLAFSKHMSIREIRETLDDVFTLRLAAVDG